MLIKKSTAMTVGALALGLFVLYLLWYWVMDMWGGRNLGAGVAF